MQSPQDKSNQAKRQARKGKGSGGGQFVNQGGPRANAAAVPDVDLSSRAEKAPSARIDESEVPLHYYGAGTWNGESRREEPWAVEAAKLKEWSGAQAGYERHHWIRECFAETVKHVLVERIRDQGGVTPNPDGEWLPGEQDRVFDALNKSMSNVADAVYIATGGIVSEGDLLAGGRRLWSSESELADCTARAAAEHGEIDLDGEYHEFSYPDDFPFHVWERWKEGVNGKLDEMRVHAVVEDVEYDECDAFPDCAYGTSDDVPGGGNAVVRITAAVKVSNTAPHVSVGVSYNELVEACGGVKRLEAWNPHLKTGLVVRHRERHDDEGKRTGEHVFHFSVEAECMEGLQDKFFGDMRGWNEEYSMTGEPLPEIAGAYETWSRHRAHDGDAVQWLMPPGKFFR